MTEQTLGMTIDQLVQLREIEKARGNKGAPGIRRELQELINRLTSSGVQSAIGHNVCFQQAKRLWDLGVGRALGHSTFSSYVTTMPHLPIGYKEDEDHPLLVLVDHRVDWELYCRLLGIHYYEKEMRFKRLEDDEGIVALPPVPFWVQMQRGDLFPLSSPVALAKTLSPEEKFATLEIGLAAYVQYPNLMSKQGDRIWFPGTETARANGCIAFQRYGEDGNEDVRVHIGHNDSCGPQEGCATFRPVS